MKWQNIPVAFPLFKHFIKLEIEPIKWIERTDENKDVFW